MTSSNDSESAQAEDRLVFIDPSSDFEIRAITPADHDTAAALLRQLPDIDTDEAARALIRSILETPKAAMLVAFQHRERVAVYALRRDGLANDLAVIAVRPDKQRRGIGRLLLQDALRRSGKRPLAAQTPEATLGFFKACGFKLVGRRVQPSGAVHFRVGWHAPGAHFKGGTSSALTTQPVQPVDRDAT
jgi:ribosomal protein S18 acetylase RimI-like enzyme